MKEELRLVIKLEADQLVQFLGLPPESEFLGVWNSNAPWSREVSLAIRNIGYRCPEGGAATQVSLTQDHVRPGELWDTILANDYDNSLKPRKLAGTWNPFLGMTLDTLGLAQEIDLALEVNPNLSSDERVSLIRDKISQALTTH